jgi:hypothetical protein
VLRRTVIDLAPRRRRSRASYVALALATIALGLAVHAYGGALGSSVQDFAGDAIWAVMIVWWTGVLAPGAQMRHRAAAALGVCFAVEASQLHHAPALDALRSTVVGRLVLGSGFDPRDLVAYMLGVLTALLIERAALRR